MNKIVSALHLFQSGAAQPGEKIGDMVRRISASGHQIYDGRGRPLSDLDLSLITANFATMQVKTEIDPGHGNQISAFKVDFSGAQLSVIRAEEEHTCSYCGHNTAVASVNTKGTPIDFCRRCGTTDFSKDQIQARSGMNLLQALEGTQHVLNYRG